MSLVNISPRHRVAIQNQADVPLTNLHALAGGLGRVRHRQDKTGLQIDQLGNAVRIQIAAQEVEDPIVEFKLRGIRRGFCLQDAVVPFVLAQYSSKLTPRPSSGAQGFTGVSGSTTGSTEVAPFDWDESTCV